MADRRLASRFQAAKDDASDAAAGDRVRPAGRLKAARRALARGAREPAALADAQAVTGAVEFRFAR
ncbi:MAG TPA: hypothetical protein VKT27_06440 [Candidatus Binataceae bacterium]|nr:hypothetical protein [Candidatus Binataceae bacterium]